MGRLACVAKSFYQTRWRANVSSESFATFGLIFEQKYSLKYRHSEDIERLCKGVVSKIRRNILEYTLREKDLQTNKRQLTGQKPETMRLVVPQITCE